MLTIRSLVVVVPSLVVACATSVTEDLSDGEGSGASNLGGMSAAGPKVSGGSGKAGNSSSSGGKASGGTGSKAFGGSAPSGGEADADGGESTGSGGSGGSGGKASGGSGGSGGKASGGSAGSGTAGAPLGMGSCQDTPVFQAGDGLKYEVDAKVAATCNGGTPCTLAQPALTMGKQYEFKCLDHYNCGTQDPGSTNWAQPPWSVTQACE